MELILAFDDNKFKLVICDNHHNNIKEIIDAYGLSDHIVENESEIFGIIERALEGSFFNKKDFDPLLMMDFLMWRHSLQFHSDTGIDLSKDDGCIICEYEKNGGNVDDWMKPSIDKTLETAKELGFFSIQ